LISSQGFLIQAQDTDWVQRSGGKDETHPDQRPDRE
jgi:hypothetical protein